MERKRVQSSNLASVGYDEEASLLEIEFNGGQIYQYTRVPRTVYEKLVKADSHGEYFNDQIKKGPYPFKKVK